MTIFKSITLLLLSCVAVTGLYSQENTVVSPRHNTSADGLLVYYFPFGSSDLLRYYAGNDRRFDKLDSLLQTPAIAAAVDTIRIIARSSPAGSEEYNLKLSQQRAAQMRTYLRWKHLQVAESCVIDIKAIGIDHKGYSVLRQSSHNLTEKQIWDLLQCASVELKLKDGSCHTGDSGDFHQNLIRDSREILTLLSASRNTDTVYVHPDRPVHDVIKDTTIVIGDDFDPALQSAADTMPATLDNVLPLPGTTGAKRQWAVGTNLLYNVILIPNLSLEIPLGERYSLQASGASAWYQTQGPDYRSYRIQMLWMEGRYWLSDSPVRFGGAFIGLYGAVGSYDIRLSKGTGPLGTLSRFSYSAGLTGGYSILLADCWRMDFSLGIGYMGGRYSKYNYSDCASCYPERGTGNRRYLGLTQAAVTLFFIFNKR